MRGLILAIAREELEVAHFMDGLTDEQRSAGLGAATSYFELAKSFYPADAVPAGEAAWGASLGPRLPLRLAFGGLRCPGAPIRFSKTLGSGISEGKT